MRQSVRKKKDKYAIPRNLTAKCSAINKGEMEILILHSLSLYILEEEECMLLS